ncbi:Pentatricopeptide repeat-containing protein [Glycine soja]|uniref:Pentatricopeptide repeat-containing protein n=1 Tax=Glycine soja TaxID=3848 RepID=A0A0B2R5W7_GLYSO|nr:Pentatricopeptide repeat-containing protein [Glycine soja]
MLGPQVCKYLCFSSALHPEHFVNHGHCFNSDSFYASLIDNSTHKRHRDQIHNQLVISGLQHNGFLMTKVVNGSSNLGQICYARKLFDEFCYPDVFMWNAIIRSYSRNMFRDTVEMYRWMRWIGVHPDGFTFPHVLTACTELLDFGLSCEIHEQIIRYRFGSDVFVQNGLVSLYAKCGHIGVAKVVFDGLYHRTIVSWTSIISGYPQNEKAVEALRMFGQMRNADVKPDWIALTPNVIMRNAMISGYAKNGHAEEAVHLFRDMISRNIKPDSVTVRVFDRNSVKDVAMWSAIMIMGYGLHACNHSGLVKEGWELFHCMKDFEIEPCNEHYSCVVDLLGRAVYLGQACAFIMKIPIEPGGIMYNSNLYACSCLWDCVAHVRFLMQEKGLNKDLGYSVIEINGKLQAFHLGDKSHPLAKEIFNELQRLEGGWVCPT